MGLLDFFRKDREEEIITSKNIKVDKEIETLLLILANLNYLNPENIDRELRIKNKEYDKSILYRLRISIREDEIETFKRYFDVPSIGYGKDCLEEIRKKLQARAKELNLAGRNKIEIVEELIVLAKKEIENYETIVRNFNQVIKSIETNKNISESEKIVLIDYWTTNYKEQELGYEINFQRKVEAMQEELGRLEFGGYGESEIKKFHSRCLKRIKELQERGYSSKVILKEIEDKIYFPMKNEYLTNVEVLRKKLKEIDESDLSEKEKETRKSKLIKSFNEDKGHDINLNEKVAEMKKDLKHLEEFGYGKEKIDEFTKAAMKIIEDGEKIRLDTQEILRNLESEFKFYVRRYQEAYNKLQEMKKRVMESAAREEEKKEEINNLEEIFEDEMGHPVDVEQRINKLIKNLEKLGYGPIKIEEFKNRISEIKEASETKNRTSIETIKSIEVTYNIYVRDIREKKKVLERTVKTIENNESLTLKERKKSIEEFKIDFDLSVGVPLDFEDKLNEFKLMLSNLPEGGYGEKAIKEFEKEVRASRKKLKNESSAYQTLRQTALIFKNRYLSNLSTFKAWKEERLEAYEGKDKEKYQAELEKQIAYMLSLSPKALDAYFEEDNKKKKEAFNNHNFNAAFRFLAKEEAKKAKDLTIFNKRIEELKEGINPYSEEDIARATRRLEEIALFDNIEKDEERILTQIEFIDTTLYHQIFQVQAKERRKSD